MYVQATSGIDASQNRLLLARFRHPNSSPEPGVGDASRFTAPEDSIGQGATSIGHYRKLADRKPTYCPPLERGGPISIGHCLPLGR